MINQVAISERASKQLRKAPKHVARKMQQWVDDVENDGLEAARKVPGYHDEPLSGNRKGQRSIRLSLKWRAIYIVKSNGNVEFVNVEEVTPHRY